MKASERTFSLWALAVIAGVVLVFEIVFRITHPNRPGGDFALRFVIYLLVMFPYLVVWLLESWFIDRRRNRHSARGFEVLPPKPQDRSTETQ